MPSAADFVGTDLTGAGVVAPILAVLTAALCVAMGRFLTPPAARLLLRARLDEVAGDLDVAWLRGRLRPDRRQAWVDVVCRVARDPRHELQADPAALLPDDLPKRYADPLRRALTDYARAELPRAARRQAREGLAVGGRTGRGVPGPTARRARRIVVVGSLTAVALAVTGTFAVTSDWLREAWVGREPAPSAPAPTSVELGSGPEVEPAQEASPGQEVGLETASGPGIEDASASPSADTSADTANPLEAAVRRAAVPRTLHSQAATGTATETGAPPHGRARAS